MDNRATNNDLTRLYRNGDISAVIRCNWLQCGRWKVKMLFHDKIQFIAFCETLLERS